MLLPHDAPVIESATPVDARAPHGTPHVGQRVRRTAPHKEIPIGMLGTIDVVHSDGVNFWVMTDGMPHCGAGFCGWTCFDAWEPISEPAP